MSDARRAKAGSKEVTPETMRGLSRCGCSVWLERYEREIVEAVESGERSSLLCYTDCGGEQLATVRTLEKRGFAIRVRRESVGGVLQCAGYNAKW